MARHCGSYPPTAVVVSRKGTFQPMFFGLKFSYVQSLGYQWPLFTKKSAQPARGKILVPVKVLSRKIAAKFRDALKKEEPELFAKISDAAWRREWVSFCKHYGRGNDAVLNYLSRYVLLSPLRQRSDNAAR